MAVRQIPHGTGHLTSGMAQLHVDFSGWNEFMKNLEPETERRVQAAIAEGLEYTKVVAQELVPEDTGRLHDSADVDHTYRKGEGASGTLTFSAQNPRDGYNYAYIQEVNEFYNHPKPGAQAHYLRDALKKTRASISVRMGKAVSQGMGASVRKANNKASSSKARSSTNKPTVVEKLAKLPIIGKFFRGRK